MSVKMYKTIGKVLKETAGLTQKGLAGALGLNPAAVNRMLHGQRKIKVDEVHIIEEYLGVLLNLSAGANDAKSAAGFKIPVCDIDENTVDWTACHPAQKESEGSFAMYVKSDNMEPRYLEGELIYAHKEISPRANQDCVIKTIDGKMHIRRFVSQDSVDLTVETFNPAQTQMFSNSDIIYVCAIVGRG
ncbi:MAG: LexA family transcriptional regulator [Proteobacteria bacterium]|nr:LexA family transcriptional regulator [Pseudomonadota bacterium]